ncbi:MAG: methyltransferase domain-containing protein, partial [Thiomonas sp.]
MTQTTLSAGHPHRPPLPSQPDFESVKTRQKVTWASGDYAQIGVTLQIVGEQLCEAIDLRAGERVLDVAAGNGNASLAAARRFGCVTAVDYVESLIESGRKRAIADALPIEWTVADAERLPFDDGSFDVVLSTFGVMFTPNQERAAEEMLRVTRAGGRIGLANWTPEGFIGELFKTIGRHVPPAAGQRPPVLWGTEPRLVELFGPEAADIRVARRQFMFRYASPAHWIDHFKAYYGPILKAFETLGATEQVALQADIVDLLMRSNRGGAKALVFPGEYLEVVI